MDVHVMPQRLQPGDSNSHRLQTALSNLEVSSGMARFICEWLSVTGWAGIG